jgi:hypothetical protein
MVPGRIVSTEDLPYLSFVPQDGRSIVLLPYYDPDEQQFYLCLPVDRQTTALVPAVALLEAAYLSRCPADPQSDRALPFSTEIVQRFSHKHTVRVLPHVHLDLINALASLHRYFVMVLYANEHDDGSYVAMVRAELEYAFVNHRAFYDRLHEIVRSIQKLYRGGGSDLPGSFAKALNKSEADLREKFSLPLPLVAFYKEREEVFLKMRYVRDNILHHGHSPGCTYLFPDGIAVSVDDKLAQQLGDFGLWPEPLLRPNRLGSALAILAFVAADMFDAMDLLGSSILSCFPQPPRPIAPGYELFIRSTVSKHVVSLDDYRGEHWLDPRIALGIAEGDENGPG